MTTKITTQINDLIASQMDIDAEEIKPEHTLEHDLGMDSLEKLELFNKVEQEYSITIPNDITEGIETVGQLDAYVSDKVAYRN